MVTHCLSLYRYLDNFTENNDILFINIRILFTDKDVLNNYEIKTLSTMYVQHILWMIPKVNIFFCSIAPLRRDDG